MGGSGGNLFRIPELLPKDEISEPLAEGGGVLVERIVSSGQATPAGEWLVGERDEWVVLLEGEAELRYEAGAELVLGPGDHVLIRAGERHRVEWTRDDPPCVWLAVHVADLGVRSEEAR
jgi:cupin 2 domain-containing protein